MYQHLPHNTTHLTEQHPPQQISTSPNICLYKQAPIWLPLSIVFLHFITTTDYLLLVQWVLLMVRNCPEISPRGGQWPGDLSNWAWGGVWLDIWLGYPPSYCGVIVWCHYSLFFYFKRWISHWWLFEVKFCNFSLCLFYVTHHKLVLWWSIEKFGTTLPASEWNSGILHKYAFFRFSLTKIELIRN